ncbi:hypothetical protein ACIA47_19345 [Micromonospora sp. NPDC051227]|uniref:hypothetical protein n=1 Tax=Micromonospora sp. NPDC051227 TaxID=3364285 RepID=UPI0037914DBB
MIPAEVRAAQRALGRYQPTPTQSQSPALPIQSTSSTDVEAVLVEILDADRVDIIGVLPPHCVDRLVELHALRETAEGRGSLPSHVRYVTPARDRVTLYRQPGVLGTLVQRWITGVAGLRNWLEPRTTDPNRSRRLEIFQFDDMFLDCVVYSVRDGVERAAILSQLPILTSGQVRPATAISTVVASRMSTTQINDLKTYIRLLLSQATPLTQRQIRCSSTENRRIGGPFVPAIRRVAAYGRLAVDDVEPVAVVAICANTASGPCVLLKPRNLKNSRDDFRKLSLVSERILIEDMSQYSRGSIDGDHEKALDDLWMAANQPEPFLIPEESFRKAAQRELFVTCGLDVVSDRLSLKGTCVLDREDEATHLGFYVFRLDLLRSTGVDELKEVQAWNPELTLVPIADLYSTPIRPRLNRLLTRKQDWLVDHVFSTQ